jgi:hypothetical protein
VAVHAWLFAVLLMWRSDSRRRTSVSGPGRTVDLCGECSVSA